jgi:hypothetical protein
MPEDAPEVIVAAVLNFLRDTPMPMGATTTGESLPKPSDTLTRLARMAPA